MRRVSRRSASPDRIAAVMSAWIRSRRVTGMAPRAPRRRMRRRSRRARERRREPIVRPATLACRSAVSPAASCVLLALRFLALPLHARLLVVLAPASLGEDAALLDLLVEAAQGALERLVLTHSDFCQSGFTSSGRGLAPASRTRCPTAQGASRRACASVSRQPAGRPPECTRALSGGQTPSERLCRSRFGPPRIAFRGRPRCCRQRAGGSGHMRLQRPGAVERTPAMPDRLFQAQPRGFQAAGPTAPASHLVTR